MAGKNKSQPPAFPKNIGIPASGLSGCGSSLKRLAAHCVKGLLMCCTQPNRLLAVHTGQLFTPSWEPREGRILLHMIALPANKVAGTWPMHHQGRESGHMGPTTHADRSFRETVAHSGLGRLGAEVTDTAPECRAETIQRVHHVGPGD